MSEAKRQIHGGDGDGRGPRRTASARQGRRWTRWLTALWTCCALVWGSVAARGAAAPTNTVVSAEERAYAAAVKEYEIGANDVAVKSFADFAAQFPKSERMPEARLFEAKARFRLAEYDTVIKRLQANINQAGRLADQYQFLIGEACFQRGDFTNSAAMYAQLLKAYPESFLRPNASFNEALSHFRLGDWAQTIARLKPPESAFQKVAQTQTNNEYVVRGYLLLAETYLLQNDCRQALEALQTVARREQNPQVSWQRQYLLTRVALANNQAAEALPGFSNVLNAATATGDPVCLANTVLLQGQILKAAGQLTNAIQVFETRRASLPPSQQNQALRQLVDWHLQTGNPTEAMANLERLVTQYPQDPALDRIRLQLANLKVDHYQRYAPGAGTNAAEVAAVRARLLEQAQTNLNLLVSGLPNSPLIGQAQLLRGWCLQEAGKVPESRDAYRDAADRPLPPASQMAARFAYANALFRLGETTNAMANYWRVVNDYATLTNAPPALRSQSLRQIVAGSAALDDPAQATNALGRLLAQHPGGEEGDRCLMLVAQLLERKGRLAEAREQLAKVADLYPKSALVPDARLAIAASFVREGAWKESTAAFDAWLLQYTNHARVAEVEYDRAWAYGQAGQETNAYHLLVSYLARFPKAPDAPAARLWLGNFFLRHERYSAAETNYQAIYQNPEWAATDLAYQARLSAGRAAFKRSGYSDAADYFKTLIEQLRAKEGTNAPSDLLCRAYIAYGDNLCADGESDKTNAVAKFAEAINAYARVPETSRLAPEAWGRTADCHLQLASGDTNRIRYIEATNFYHKVMTNEMAAIEHRSNAQLGMALVYEKLAADPRRAEAERANLLSQALQYYLGVVLRGNLRPNERPCARFVVRAGLEACRLLETQARWSEAANLYSELLTSVPASKPIVEKKLDNARRRAG